MTELIKVYHGTRNLEGIASSGAIKSYDFLYGEQFWLRSKKEYDALTRKFAEVARTHLECGLLIGDHSAEPELLANDEALADLIQGYDIKEVEMSERGEYGEIKRGVFVYLACSRPTAGGYIGTGENGKVGALLEVEIPRTLLRPSIQIYEGDFNTVEVPKEVSLEYLQQIAVNRPYLERATQILGEHGLGNIPVIELK